MPDSIEEPKVNSVDLAQRTECGSHFLSGKVLGLWVMNESED